MKPSLPKPRSQACVAQPRAAWYLPVKSLLDFTLGFILLIVLSPVILLCAALVKLTSKGPAFYTQTRVGKDGRLFKIIKLRSMYQDAEVGTGAVWSTGNDSRITPIGRILRATHLDEFPQLINVVIGDMSLVGPRPERPEFVRGFEMQIDNYAARLLVRPGITGIAQLRLPADTDIRSVCQKLEFDLYYVRHVGPWLDLVAMIATGVQLVASLVSAVVPSRLWIPTQEAVRADAVEFALTDSNLAPQHGTPQSGTAIPIRLEQPMPDTATSGAFSAT